MILYLSSKQFGHNEDFLKNWIKKYNNKILLILNALDAKGKEKINNNVNEDKILLEKIGFDVKIIDLKDYFGKNNQLKDEVLKYNAFCIMGGNVFVLREAMKYSGFDKILKELSNKEDYLYIGYSAGCYVLSKKLDIFKIIDEPIDFYKKGEIIYEGLDLIDYIFIPHYKSNYHKVKLIDKIVDICSKEKIKYKAFKDGEVSIEECKI